MQKKIERLLPHGAILICNMYIVFFLIDRVNPAMNFIDNRLTKGLLLVMCAIAFYNAWRALKPVMARRSAPPVRPAPQRPSRPQAGGRDRDYAPRTGDSRAAPARPVRDGRRAAVPSRPNASAPPRRASAYDRRGSYDDRYGYDRERGYRREGERR